MISHELRREGERRKKRELREQGQKETLEEEGCIEVSDRNQGNKYEQMVHA